jgi:hypothetical protein
VDTHASTAKSLRFGWGSFAARRKARIAEQAASTADVALASSGSDLTPFLEAPEPSPELAGLFQAAQFQVDFQLKMAERLDAKARGLAAMTTAFAAAAQAYALQGGVLGTHHHTLKWFVVGVALAAVVAFGCALVATAYSVFLQGEKEIEPVLLMAMIEPAALGDRHTALDLVHWHLDLAYDRKLQNDARASRMRVAQVLCLATLVLCVAEVVLAVFTRL